MNPEDIQNEFLIACQNNNEKKVKELLNSSSELYLNYTENDYELIKIIEEKIPKLLEYVLLSRKKEEGRISQGNTYIDANTYYCVLSEHSKNNTKLALNILIHGNEYLDLIPNQIKTPQFLKKLSKEYKRNIFDFDFTYGKEYESFLIAYIKEGNTFSKKVSLTEELLNDREFILKLTKYKSNCYSFIEQIYHNDVEIMKQVAVNDSNAFQYMSAKMRNKISQEESIALKLIENDPINYLYLNNAMQMNENCMEKVLSKKPAIYEGFLSEIKNNIEKTISFINKYDIDILFLSDAVKNNFEIAKIMTEKKGSNLENFPLFKEVPELINLALKTSKKLSLIPENQKTDDKLKEIILLATKEENTYNLHYMTKNIKEDRNFVLKLIENDLLFKEDIFALVNDYGNHKNDYDLVKECIKKHNDLYGRFLQFKEDYEIIHIYIEAMKKETNGVFNINIIPQKIRAEASMLKIGVDKYVFNKILEKRSENWEINETVKVKKMKI